jgi:Holliday junction DNA helicase RuvA
MITFLEGLLVDKQPTSLVVNVGGVGYDVRIPLSSYDRLPAPNAPIRILTYDHVREDDHTLYGFATETERKLFVLLMSVSGIGPKLALSVLSGLAVRDIKLALAGGDVKRLSSITGIGRKTAERMVVELRDKISAGEALEAATAGRPLSSEEVKLRDAILALVSLGYKRAEAEQLVSKVAAKGAEGDTAETLVRKALAG